MDFEQACQEALAFRDERDWRQFHNPKDLALSLSLEAAELLEAWQWSGADTSAAGRGDKVAEELADVLIYACYLAPRPCTPRSPAMPRSTPWTRPAARRRSTPSSRDR